MGHPKETLDQLEERHAKEKAELINETKKLLKATKKSGKAAVEAQMLQQEYDLRARHNDELDLLESQIGTVCCH